MILKNEIIINQIIKNINLNKKISKHFDFTYKSQKHEIKVVLTEILKVIKYALPWREIINIPYSTAYSVYKKLLKLNILKSTYIELLKIYFQKSKNRKLKYLITDTTCVNNRCGSQMVEYNGHKKKKCTKVSFICDSVGVPVNVSIDRGARCDSKILLSQLDNEWLICNDLLNNNKKYILADSMYDSSEVIDRLKKLGFIPIINKNKRNNKGKIYKMSQSEKNIYSKRIKIEHTNNLFKNSRRCYCRYDRNIDTFFASIYCSLIYTLISKL